MIQFDEPLNNDEELALSKLLFLCELIAGAGDHDRINPLGGAKLGPQYHSRFNCSSGADPVRQVREGLDTDPIEANVPP